MRNFVISFGMLGVVTVSLAFLANYKGALPNLFGSAFAERNFRKTCLWLDDLGDSVREEAESGNDIRLEEEVEKLRGQLANVRGRQITWNLQVAMVAGGRIHLVASYMVVNGQWKTFKNFNDWAIVFGANLNSGDTVTMITLVRANKSRSSQNLGPTMMSFPVKDVDPAVVSKLRTGDQMRITAKLNKIDIVQSGFRIELEDVELQSR